MSSATFASAFGSVVLEHVRTGVLALTVEGAPDASAADELARAIERHLAADRRVAIRIDATKQDGAVPELRVRLASLIAAHRAALASFEVLAGSSQTELGYRRLADESGGLVQVTRTLASHAHRESLCPPPVHADESEPALLLVTTPPSLTDEEMSTFLAWHRGWMSARREPYAIVLDLRRTEKLSPRQREMITSGMERSEKLCRGTAMVFTSVVLRGFLTAIFWIKKPRYPTRVFNGLDEASAWAREITRAVVTAQSP